MLSFIIPTRDRPEHLAITLARLSALPADALERAGGAEVIVADNASRQIPTPPDRLGNGVPVHLVLMARNDGAAARNAAAARAQGDWLVMLDDDSHPTDESFVAVLAEAPREAAAIGAEIVLDRGAAWACRESGGLPEVFIGCGAAIRRSVFLDPDLGAPMPGIFPGGGYDPAFHFYAEEYDLAARIILSGSRVVHHRGFRVVHRKVSTGRDMNTILRRLVRNNAWVEQRYAPERERRAAIQRVVNRYRAIAEKEGALEGYTLGLGDLDDTLDQQPRAEMTSEQYDRFTGLAACRAHLIPALHERNVRRVSIIEAGKNAWVVERAITESGVDITASPDHADALVIGTMSPGPMLDAAERARVLGRPVITPWLFEQSARLAPARAA